MPQTTVLFDERALHGADGSVVSNPELASPNGSILAALQDNKFALISAFFLVVVLARIFGSSSSKRQPVARRISRCWCPGVL